VGPGGGLPSYRRDPAKILRDLSLLLRVGLAYFSDAFDQVLPSREIERGEMANRPTDPTMTRRCRGARDSRRDLGENRARGIQSGSELRTLILTCLGIRFYKNPLRRNNVIEIFYRFYYPPLIRAR